jgi:hypothetical protein
MDPGVSLALSGPHPNPKTSPASPAVLQIRQYFQRIRLLVITGNHHQQVSSITSSALIDAPGKITSITSKTLEP